MDTFVLEGTSSVVGKLRDLLMILVFPYFPVPRLCRSITVEAEYIEFTSLLIRFVDNPLIPLIRRDYPWFTRGFAVTWMWLQVSAINRAINDWTLDEIPWKFRYFRYVSTIAIDERSFTVSFPHSRVLYLFLVSSWCFV